MNQFRNILLLLLGLTLSGSFPEVSRFSIVYDKPSYGKRIGQF